MLAHELTGCFGLKHTILIAIQTGTNKPLADLGDGDGDKEVKHRFHHEGHKGLGAGLPHQQEKEVVA